MTFSLEILQSILSRPFFLAGEASWKPCCSFSSASFPSQEVSFGNQPIIPTNPSQGDINCTWGSWDACPVTCGGGSHQRFATGSDCNVTWEWEVCNTEPCCMFTIAVHHFNLHSSLPQCAMTFQAGSHRQMSLVLCTAGTNSVWTTHMALVGGAATGLLLTGLLMA